MDAEGRCNFGKSVAVVAGLEHYRTYHVTELEGGHIAVGGPMDEGAEDSVYLHVAKLILYVLNAEELAAVAALVSRLEDHPFEEEEDV